MDVELSAGPRDVGDFLWTSAEPCSVLVDGPEERGRLNVELTAGPSSVGDGLRLSVFHDPGCVALHLAEDRCVPLSEFGESVNDIGDVANVEVSDVLLYDAGELVQKDLEL